MSLNKQYFASLLAAALLQAAPAFPAAKRGFGDITFIHASDVHAPSETSRRVIGEITSARGLELSPYGIRTEEPEFAIVSGDITEFGGGGGVWDEYMSYWKDARFPVYHQLGNHDGPWFSDRAYLRGLYGACSWSFDRAGFHFIGLDTSVPHDPRANISEEQIAWLKRDLAGLKPETPVFLTLHHPLDDTYFGSPYAVLRVLDLLRPYNLAGVLIGHGHRADVRTVFGLDNIQGGSTIGPEPRLPAGFSAVSVRDGVLRAAHKLRGASSADVPVLEKRVPERSPYPKIEILSPAENEVCADGAFTVKARLSGGGVLIASAAWLADNMEFDETKWSGSAMSCRDGVCEAQADCSGWTPGAHYVQALFTGEDGKKYTKSVRLSVKREPDRLLWRTMLGGSCKGPASAAGDTVYAGATDMKLYALDRKSGRVKWSYATGGDIASKPLAADDTVYVGSGDGRLYALRADGRLKWKFEAKGGIFGSPVLYGGLVLFGSDDTAFYAVDAETGRLAWAFEEPGYSIEVKPFVKDGAVYFGAWDGYMYSLDAKTGALRWRGEAAGSASASAAGRSGLRRYLSSADSGPSVSGGRVFVADRDSRFSVLDADTGVIVSSGSDCVAVGLSEDGKYVYQRKPAGGLSKMSLDGDGIWTVPAELDSVPAAPVEKDGAVYTVSRLGLVQAFDASDGTLLWEYSATPLRYVLSEAEADGGAVYVTGMDGSVTALSAGRTRR